MNGCVLRHISADVLLRHSIVPLCRLAKLVEKAGVLRTLKNTVETVTKTPGN